MYERKNFLLLSFSKFSAHCYYVVCIAQVMKACLLLSRCNILGGEAREVVY